MEIEPIVKDYLPNVYNFIYRLVRDQDMASDITQDVFIKVWQNLKKYDPEKNFKTWLYTVARRTTIDWLRKKKGVSFSDLNRSDDQDFAETVADEGPDPEKIFEQKELAEQLDSAVEKLSPLDQTIIILHHDEELTFAAMAEVLDQPLNTIKSRYRRALLKLRKQLTAPK